MSYYGSNGTREGFPVEFEPTDTVHRSELEQFDRDDATWLSGAEFDRLEDIHRIVRKGRRDRNDLHRIASEYGLQGKPQTDRITTMTLARVQAALDS